MSDMDNLDFVQGDGFRAMQQRTELCSGSKCFPLTWSMQPNLATLTPAILRWYVNKARQTKQDWFVLPPSGALYAYPSQFPDELQSKYVQMTNAAAGILNTSGSADWEFFGMWHSAIEHYFPKYQQGPGGVKLFMLDQV